MNVGSARLNNVNSSQPQILHSPSQQSLIAADHSSSSGYASEASTVAQRDRDAQYETPPSRPHSEIASKPAESEMTLPTRPRAAHPPPLNFRRSQAPRTQVPPSDLYREVHDTSPPTPGVDESPYIRFAIEQLTRDEELLGRGRQGSVSSLEYPVDRIIPDEGLGYYTAPVTHPLPSQSPERPLVAATEASRQAVDDIFIPVTDPAHYAESPELGYLPLILRPTFPVLLILFCLLMIAALIFCNVWALRHNGLYDYDGTGTSTYFIFQFLPQLLGIIMVVWIFVLQAAVYRIIPFASMTSRFFLDRVLQDMPIRPANFVLPDLRHFRCGEPVVGTCLVVFWISYFTVPLLSCTFQTGFFDVDGVRRWRWTSVQTVVWILVALYALVIAASVLLILRFRKSQSALLWDPVSLADLIPLFRKSNIIADLDRSEISESLRAHIPPRPLRLGYWTTSSNAQIFHTVGEANAPARKLSNEKGVINEKHLSGFDSQNFSLEYQRYSNAESFTRNIHSPFFRYRWTPWFLRDSAVVAWIVAALVLYLAFLVVSFVNQAVARGFPPRLNTITNSRGFSPSNFLFSFIPALLGMILFLAWQPIDTYFRAIQPFTNLSDPQGATAEHSLLLAYPSCYPLQITLLALINRDFKVAWISLISLLSLAIPVLAGGIFTAQFFEQAEVRIAATMPAYYTLCVVLGIYAFSFLIIWPKRKRYLPHSIETLADHLSFLYQSPLLSDEEFRELSSKRDLVSRLLVRDVSGGEKTKLKPRYAFGIYVGRDGREHLGIDRLTRVGTGMGSGEMLVPTPTGREGRQNMSEQGELV